MNIVFIISDTFRSDHLSYFGKYKVRTPNLDRLASKSVVFENAYACSFPTMPARADILTGRWTFTYLGWAPLPRTDPVLPQLFRNAGYLTKATVDTPFFLRNGYGYDQGFDDFEWIRGQLDYNEHGERKEISRLRRFETDYFPAATMLAAERWLQRHYKDKFFLYVDTWDPHEPWDPPYWYTELYYPDYDGRICSFPCYDLWQDRGLTEEDLELAHACYCGEITLVDRWVGHLLDGIEGMGLMENTVVIFTSDHGHYFGEHGQFGKAMKSENKLLFSPLYKEVVNIPFLMYIPGVKPMKNAAMVSLSDLMPTILELADLKIPPSVQSESLVPMLYGEHVDKRNFVVTSWPLYNPGEFTRVIDAYQRRVAEPLPSTITTDNWSLIYGVEGWPAELYNIASDPKQEKNLIQEEEDIAQAILEKYISLLEATGTAPNLLAKRRCL